MLTTGGALDSLDQTTESGHYGTITPSARLVPTTLPCNASNWETPHETLIAYACMLVST